MVINGDRAHLNMVLRNLQVFYEKGAQENSAEEVMGTNRQNNTNRT